jgi:hypothetical protein
MPILMNNRYASDFVSITLEPCIHALSKHGSDYLVETEVPIANLFRQIEGWRHDYSELPRCSPIFGNDPGIPEEEAREVYIAMDLAFQHVFPDLFGYDRERSAIRMQEVIRSVFGYDGEPETPGDKERLLDFMGELVKRLKSDRGFQ